MAEFELKALITGVDRLSPALSKMQKKIRGFKRQAEEASQGGLALGGGLAAGLTLSLKSYADQENAATGLKVAMMDANGEVGKSFQEINKLAIGLGNQLPGTTADFQNMMQMLVRQGIPAENILGGVGKATAYLAVQLKKTPEAAAEFAAKMQDATGTASEDMMGLFDTIQKAFYLGVDDTNMLSFFTKTSSVLKMVNKDGLQAAQSLAPISVMMDQMGMNGESAGNALRKVIQSGLSVKKIRDVNKVMARQKLGVQLDFTDGKGSFGGLDNMFRQLAKLRKLTDVTGANQIPDMSLFASSNTATAAAQKFPSGLILQCGQLNGSPNVSSTYGMRFPMTFSRVLAVTVTLNVTGASGQPTVSATNVHNTGFDITVSPGSGYGSSVDAYYIAMGY